jgi:Tfp pilus assembly protein PilO
MNGLSEPVITRRDWVIVGCILAGLVVVALLVCVFVYVPQRAEMKRFDGEIATKQAELKTAQEIAAKRDELERKLQRIEQIIARFEAKLPTLKDIPKLYQQFQLAAGDANVIVRSIEKLQEEKKPARIEVPYQFKVTGSYHETASFINTLEMGEPFVKTTDLHVGQQKRGVSDSEFKVTTYLFVEETPAEVEAVGKSGEAAKQ